MEKLKGLKKLAKSRNYQTESNSSEAAANNNTENQTPPTNASNNASNNASHNASHNASNATIAKIKRVRLELPPTCWGKVTLCGKETCEKPAEGSPSFINVISQTGNLYANVIEAKNMPVDQDYKKMAGVNYDDERIDWSHTMKHDVLHYLKLSEDPKNFDPVFLFHLGSKEANSSLYQQWDVTSNPAYAQLKPWWISTFSFTLMSTATYVIHGDLSPGFCPYTPYEFLQKKLK